MLKVFLKKYVARFEVCHVSAFVSFFYLFYHHVGHYHLCLWVFPTDGQFHHCLFVHIVLGDWALLCRVCRHHQHCPVIPYFVHCQMADRLVCYHNHLSNCHPIDSDMS